MIAAIHWTIVLPVAITAFATLGAAFVGSYLSTRGQVALVREQAAANRQDDRSAIRRADLMQVQSMIAVMTTNLARDKIYLPTDEADRNAASLEREKNRQELRGIIGRIQDPALSRLLDAYIDESDSYLGVEGFPDLLSEREPDPLTPNVGDLVERIHDRVGELLAET